MGDLKPCPFCGGRAEIQRGAVTKYVMCLSCEVMGPNLADDCELIAAWNTRAPDPVREAVAEAEKMFRWYGDLHSQKTPPDTDKAKRNYDMADKMAAALAASTPAAPPQQARAAEWVIACFGEANAMDRRERCDRFAEEAMELVQSLDMPKARVLALVDYVYGRDKGDPAQEVGGVRTTLAALCHAVGIDQDEAAEAALARVNRPEVMAKLRAKQATRPTGSALPVADVSPSYRTP